MSGEWIWAPESPEFHNVPLIRRNGAARFVLRGGGAKPARRHYAAASTTDLRHFLVQWLPEGQLEALSRKVSSTFSNQIQKVPPVTALGQWRGPFQQLVVGQEAEAPGNLLGTSY